MSHSKTKLAKTMQENTQLRFENARLRRDDLEAQIAHEKKCHAQTVATLKSVRLQVQHLESNLDESNRLASDNEARFGAERVAHVSTRQQLDSVRAEIRAILEGGVK